MKTSLFVAALFPLLAICRPAFAAPPAMPIAPQPTPEQVAAEGANKLRDQGNEAMLGMRYSDALASYQQALRLSPESAGLHYSIARAYQFLGEYPEALGALESFEKYATPETKAKVGKLDALYAQIRPRISTLKLTCSAPGARVLLRDKVIGTTPLPPTRLPSGAATIQIELDGFFPEARDVVLPGGGELAIEVTLGRKSSSGLLSIRSEPVGALVALDGKEIGTSSPKLEVTVPAGSHELVVRREGYDDARVPIVLDAGAKREVAIPLEKSKPIVSRWWFWTAVGGAVAGGIVLTYALTTEKGASHGSLSPGQVGAP